VYGTAVSGTIVVGYDESDVAQRALGRAIEEARDSGRRLVVVSVLEMPLNPEGPQNYGTLDDSPARMIPLVLPPELEPVLAHARALVEAAALKADYAWAVGEPADAIINVAKEHQAGLIVLGAHHHGFFARLLGSDVGAGVKREADCDVLVVD
jgi:nucleotide-binding universal stress UspA family protein